MNDTTNPPDSQSSDDEPQRYLIEFSFFAAPEVFAAGDVFYPGMRVGTEFDNLIPIMLNVPLHHYDSALVVARQMAHNAIRQWSVLRRGDNQ